MGGQATLGVAMVGGDDLMDRLDELLAAGHRAGEHGDGRRTWPSVRDRVQSANVYIGAAPHRGGPAIKTPGWW